MKRTLALLLSAALLTAPAAAAGTTGSTDQRLAQVTRAVKDTLHLDDSYTAFHGTLSSDALRTLWQLNWEDADGGTLTVTAGDDGTIYRYDLTPADQSWTDPGLPAFPAVSRADALQTAQAFADQVLGPNEGADLSDADDRPSLTADTYNFNTALTLYGLDTPIDLSVTVDADTGRLLQFSRSDRYTPYLGTPTNPADLGLTADPASNPAAYSKAQSLLEQQLSLSLRYVLSEDGKTASLRYVPDQTDAFYVDAATGKLENLTERSDALYDKATTENAAASGGLSEAEQAGIAQMEGVLSQDALDGKVRAVSALGLSAFSLSSCRYFLDDEQAVWATLYYTRSTAEDSRSRWVTVNAKTGALERVSGGSPWPGEDFHPTVSADTARKTAADLVQQLWPDLSAASALYETTEAGADRGAHTFVFCQQVNGYFFPTNRITVSVDATDGAVVSLSRQFDAQPTFDSPDGLISDTQARTAWLDTFDTRLHYLAVPEETDPALAEQGYAYLDRLTLAFTLVQEKSMLGVDAKTGLPVAQPQTSDFPQYSDLSQSWAAEQAKTLADYRIGWLGGKLLPTQPLTQLDMLALLCSADGLLIDLSDPDAAERVYQHAYYLGLVTPADRAADQTVTRAELVRTILDYGGYGAAARIPGIYRCTFTDADAIPQAYYGYAAIAQGLSMVTGDEAGRFAADQTATREEAIAMLYQFIAR